MPSQRGSTQSRFGNLQIVRAQGQVVVPHPTPLLCMAMAPPPPPPASVVASAPLAGEGIQQASLGTGRPVWVDTDRRTEQSQGSVGNPSLLHRSVGTPRTERECGRTYVG